MWTAADTAHVTDTLAKIGSAVEQPVTLFSFSSVGTSGTTAEAGDPQTVTFGTTATYARVNAVDLRTIEKVPGLYQQGDREFTIRGSFTERDAVAWDGGTYKPIQTPVRIYMGSDLYWQATCREIKS
jgi:hypothetical protein